MSPREALELLKQKREALGTADVARRLGYSQATIRSLCTGHYPGDTKIALDQVVRVFVDVVVCPHAGETLGRAECRQRSQAPRPFGGASKLRWWEACQVCQQKSGD